MAIFYDLLARLCQLFFFITSWLVQGLTFVAGSLEPTSPSPDLPVTSRLTDPLSADCLSPIIFDSQVTTHERDCHGPPKLLSLPQSILERIKIKEQKTTHAMKSKPHDIHGSPLDDIQVNIGKVERQLLVNGALAEVSDGSASCPSSPTSSICFTPSLLNSGTTSSMTSPSPSPKIVEHNQYERRERALPIDNTGVEIGDLGKRRGFKGAPLFTQDTRKGSFFSLPIPSSRNGSPNHAQRSSPRSFPSGPRSPFATVSNLMRSASPKSPRPIKEVSQDLQDFYDEGDPFATHGETFLTPSFLFGIVLTANLDNFAPYYQHKRTHRRMLPLKRKSSYDDLRSAAFPISTVLMQTTIYDLAVSVNLPSALVSAKNKNREPNGSTDPSFSTGCLSPKIMLTSPSIPSSPTRTISVANTLPVVLESAHRLQVPVKHVRPSKVKTELKDKNSFVSDPFPLTSGAVVNLHDLGAYEASLEMSPSNSKLSSDPRSEANVHDPFILNPTQMDMTDKPAATHIFQDSEDILTGESFSDITHKLDQEDIPPGPGFSSPVFVPTANLYEFSAHTSPAKDASSPLRRKVAHADLRDTTPTKLRKPPIAKLDTNVYDLSIYGVDVDLPRPKKRTPKLSSRLTKPHLEVSDLIAPPAQVKRASSQLCPFVLPKRVASRTASAASSSIVSAHDDDRTFSPAHYPGDAGCALRSGGLNEIIAQLDGGNLILFSHGDEVVQSL